MSESSYLPPPSPPPPPPPVLPPAAPSSGFDFAKPFTFVFEDPQWVPKILIGGLFYIAGFFIIGWFFLFGYFAQTARNVIEGVERPLPEWNDLGDFFTEGVTLCGIVLIYMLPVLIIALFLGIPAALLSAVEHREVQALGGVFAGCLPCLIMPLGLAVGLFLPAALLRAVAERRFGAAFEFGACWAFIRANLGNYLLAFVVALIARFLGGLGIILFCIGVVFTAFWALVASAHAYGQVWRYRTR